MSQKIFTSIIVRGEQTNPPFVAQTNNGSDAFAIGADGYVYIYSIQQAPISPTFSYLVLGSSGQVQFTDVVGATGASGSSGTSGSSGSSGTSGSSGSSGTSGIDGNPGTSGTSGIDGTSGETPFVYLNSSDTITFVTQSLPGGYSYSAYIPQNSLTASLLNTGSNGGATAGYVLAADNNGNFQWIQSGGGSIAVADYLTGTTFSNVQNIIFRGGVLSVPVGSTATAVNITGPSPTVTVWIPAPNYVSYFAPSLGSGSARYISQPTSNTYNNTPGNSGQFGVGSWSPSTNFSNSTTRSTINSSSSFTAFTETEFACFNNGTTMSFTLYNYDGSILSQISNYIINAAGSTTSNGITITVNSFLPDSDRYKASVSGTIAIGTLFPNGGRFSWNVTHYNGEGAGNAGYGIYSSTSSDIFYDNDGSISSANIAGGADFDELTPTTVQYSGVKFYAINSTFALTASNINLLNDISFPTTKQIDFTCFSMAISGSLDGYADGTKPAGSIITGWAIDWNNSGLTYSRTATVNSGSNYIPGFSTNNTISNSPTSFVRSTIYDWATVGFSQSVSRAMLFDTYTPGTVTIVDNPIDSENGRLSVSGVMSSGTSAFNSTLSLSTTNTDELQYIFGRVIYPQTDFTDFYPTFNFTANVDYSSLSPANKTFTIYTDLDNNYFTNVAFNGYRWHVTSYSKSGGASFGGGSFILTSNFSEAVLHYNSSLSTAGSANLVILIGIDSSGLSTTPDKFIFVSGDYNGPSPVYPGRDDASNFNLDAGTKRIKFTKGSGTATVAKIWLFIGMSDSATGKNLYLSNVNFSPN